MCKFIIACLISLSALSFSSCTQKKVATSVAYMDFPQTIELKARVQPLDTALFRYPFRVRVQGDKAVVMDLHGTDYFCHVFHYPRKTAISVNTILRTIVVQKIILPVTTIVSCVTQIY